MSRAEALMQKYEIDRSTAEEVVSSIGRVARAGRTFAETGDGTKLEIERTNHAVLMHAVRHAPVW